MLTKNINKGIKIPTADITIDIKNRSQDLAFNAGGSESAVRITTTQAQNPNISIVSPGEKQT